MLFLAGCGDKSVEPDHKPPLEGEIVIRTDDIGGDIVGELVIPDKETNKAQGEREGEWLKLKNVGTSDTSSAYVVIYFRDRVDFRKFKYFYLVARGAGEKLYVDFIDLNGNGSAKQFDLLQAPDLFAVDIPNELTGIELDIYWIVFHFGNSVDGQSLNEPEALIYIKDNIALIGSVPLYISSLNSGSLQKIAFVKWLADVSSRCIGLAGIVGGIRLRRMPRSSRRTRTYSTNNLICR